MFAMTLALLTGLGAVVAARYAGWLGKQEVPVVQEKEIQVLVAARNLFPGDVIDGSYVRTRALRAEERPDYEANKKEYLPAVAGAAALRVANKPIEADSPLLRKDLKEMVKPEPLHQRLLPNMRAVNLSVEKDQSAGGLIQAGEWVDVYLTSSVSNGESETTRTAPIAQSVRVIAKRNVLWNVFAGLPDNKPVHFTIEANPYRAGLIEFSKTKGSLTLVPLSAAEQRVLEDKRTRLMAGGPTQDKLLPVSFAAGRGVDTGTEEVRVEQFNRGEYSIGTQDLVKIFDLTTTPPPRPKIVVEQFSGLVRTHVTSFGPDGDFMHSEDPRKRRPPINTGAGRKNSAGATFTFSAPGASCSPSKRKK
jgi:Flp pilus assembly protein CpaB